MRKEQFSVGSIVHVYNRGNRKQEIVRDELDRWRFLQALYYFNDEHSVSNPFRTLEELLKPGFNKVNTEIVWPKEWPARRPLAKIIAFTLMENHFHVIFEEIREGGISRFMHKFGTGVTNRFNTRYEETGRLFQGPYKAKLVDSDNYLTYLSIYVHVKNIFELYSGGFNKAIKNFDQAFEFAKKYSYSSLATYCGYNNHPIIDKDNLISELTLNKREFKDLAQNCLEFISFDDRSMDFQFC